MSRRQLRWLALLWMVIALFLAARWAHAQDTLPPPSPSVLVVQPNPVLGLNGVIFTLTFSPVLDPPSNTPVPTYTWGAGFSDGQQATGIITAGLGDPLTWALTMPYHCGTGATCLNDATIGFACLKAKDAAGNLSVDQACVPIPVPAKPLAMPSTATVRLGYTEPTTSDCTDPNGVPLPGPFAKGGNCTPVAGDPTTPTCPVLDDLKTIRASYTINGGPAQTIDFLASKPTGGTNIDTTFTVGQNTGLLSLTLKAIDTCDNVSKISIAAQRDLATTIPFAGTAQFTAIVQ